MGASVKIVRGQRISLGIEDFNLDQQRGQMPKPLVQKLSFNKLNNYGRHRVAKGKSMLPIQMDKVKTLAILDMGAGVSISTKAMWIKWGKLYLRKTRMEL